MRIPLRMALTAWALLLCVLSVGVLTPSAAAAQEMHPSDAGATPASEAVVQVADWVIASRDNRGLAFVIIDKVNAELFVFNPKGELLGSAPALLGLAVGDDSVPGIGDRPLSTITPEERTTHAGRFVASFGSQATDSNILWVDYETSVSLHPVVTTNPTEKRLERLLSPGVDDNRITFGCINVPTEFYQNIVLPVFTGAKAVVYVLPETRPIETAFQNFRPQERHLAALVVRDANVAAADASATAADPSDATAALRDSFADIGWGVPNGR